MDREKVNEAAEEHTIAVWGEPIGEYIEDVVAYDAIRDAYKQGTDWLMQQPLSERLTEEEKEKILEIHTTNASIITESNDKVLNAYSTGVMTAIERIFKDLFKEK